MQCFKPNLSVLIFHSESIAGYPSGELHVAQMENHMLNKIGVNSTLFDSGTGKFHGVPLMRNLSAITSNMWSFDAYNFVTAKIAEYQPDIVHFHGLFPFLSASALAAAHQSGAAVVQTLHNGRWVCLEGGFYRDGKYCDDCVSVGSWSGVHHGCKRGVVASLALHAANMSSLAGGRLFRWVDRFIAVSDFIRDQHIRAGFPIEKIVVKNNGLNLGRLRNVCHPDSRAGVAYVGRVSRAKGSDVLKALMDVLKAPIHVVGDGPDLAELRQYCDSRAYGHVRFWGKQPQDQCFEVMASVCCTVVPSQCGEASPLTAVESLGLGTPVVGFDVGGLGTLLHTSRGGLAIAANDFSNYVAAVQHLLDHPDKASDLGAVGMAYVDEYLGIERNTNELLAIYESVLNERKSHADCL